MVPFPAQGPGRTSWGQLGLVGLLGAGGLTQVAQGFKMAQAEEVKFIFPRQRLVVYSLMTQEIRASFLGPP